MVVGLLMVAYTSSFIDRQIMSLLVDPIRADLGISDTQFSLLAGLAFSIFYSVMGLPLGWVADRMSRRMLIIVGMIAWSVMTALCGLATSFLALFIARMGVGIGEAALSPAAYSLISDHFPPERRARAISAYAMGPYLGSGLALIIGGQVIEAASGLGAVTLPLVGELAPWQLVFLAVGLPGIPIALLFLLVREPVRRGLAPQGSDTELLPFIKARRTLFLLLFLGFSVFGIAGISYLVWIPAVFIRVHGWTAGDIGVAYGLILLLHRRLGVGPLADARSCRCAGAGRGLGDARARAAGLHHAAAARCSLGDRFARRRQPAVRHAQRSAGDLAAIGGAEPAARSDRRRLFPDRHHDVARHRADHRRLRQRHRARRSRQDRRRARGGGRHRDAGFGADAAGEPRRLPRRGGHRPRLALSRSRRIAPRRVRPRRAS